MNIREFIKKSIFHGGLYYSAFIVFYSLVNFGTYGSGAGVFVSQILLFLPAAFIFAFANSFALERRFSFAARLGVHFALTAVSFALAFLEALRDSPAQRKLIVIILFTVLYFVIFAVVFAIAKLLAKNRANRK